MLREAWDYEDGSVCRATLTWRLRLAALAWMTMSALAWTGSSPASEPTKPARQGANASTAEERLRSIEDGFFGVEDDYERLQADIDAMVRVRFDLEPALLLPGEEVKLTITARTARRPNRVLEVTTDCYAEDPSVARYELAWEKAHEADRYQAIWRWTPPACGNYLLRWTCDIGGDVQEFFRNFSVVDRGHAVMILNSTSHRRPRPEPDFHELHLPFSYWAESTLFGRRATADSFARISRGARQYGDDPGLMIFKGGAYIRDDMRVFYDEPAAVQRMVLECYQKLWKMHGFDRPLRSLYTYGMGNGPARVARSLGYDLLGALCADQNWGDGPFKINHWGMPSRPYFVSRDDFRRPGDGGPRGVVGVQQCERQTVLCRDYNCVYSFEAGVCYALDQYAGITRPRTVSRNLQSREMDFLHCFLECAQQCRTPYLFSTGFEMNGVWPETAALNRLFMETLVHQAREAPIAYTTAAAASDFLRRHYRHTPETVLYLPDVFAGLTFSGKPVIPISSCTTTSNTRSPAWTFASGSAKCSRTVPSSARRSPGAPKLIPTRRTGSAPRSKSLVVHMSISGLWTKAREVWFWNAQAQVRV